ncbi:MAG: hypothetical protein LBU36_04410 [Clostridiales bacterium]|jgi:hypothetical protein|nr:hypothetical protein [Clostridiales bacterium]
MSSEVVISASRYVCAPLLSDAEGGRVYGPAFTVAEEVCVKSLDAPDKITFRADDGETVTVTYLKTEGHRVVLPALTPELAQALRSGRFGAAFRLPLADGRVRYVRYLKGVFSAVPVFFGGSPDFSPKGVFADFYPETCADGSKIYYTDGPAPGASAEDFESLFFSDFNYVL